MHTLLEAPVTKTQATAARGKVFEDLYLEAFPGFVQWVKRRGGTLEDSRDAFQDALLIYYEKPHSQAISPPAYVAGIAKHRWLRKFRKGIVNTDLSEAEKLITLPDDISDNSVPSILNLLERAGKKCLNVLTAFYYDKLPMEELAETFGFRSERSATVQKYKCLEKIRNVVKEKNLDYNDYHA